MFKTNTVDNILTAIVVCFVVWGGFFIYSANEEKQKAIKQDILYFNVCQENDYTRSICRKHYNQYHSKDD